MAYYKTCPECGASLDPGEVCDCHEAAAKPQRSKVKFTDEARTKRTKFRISEKIRT